MRLEVFQHGQLLQEVSLQDAELWVGRDDSCKIKLDDRAISRKHALIRSSQQGLEFEKVSEFGWVKLNGQNSSQSKLKAGDRLEFGSYEIRVSADQVQSSSPVPVSLPTVELAIAPSEDAVAEVSNEEGLALDVPSDALEIPLNPETEAPTPDVFGMETAEPISFEETSGNDATRVFTNPENVKAILNFGHGNQYEIVDDEIAIGRSQQCHVVLEDRRSSRKHSLIKRDGKKYILKDLGSANGTLVGGERIDEHELHSGDDIQIGDTHFTFQMVQADYEVKKQEFISVPQPELQMAPAELMPASHDVFGGGMAPPHQPEAPPVSPAFEAPSEEKKTILGKYLERYRTMNTKKQVIYGVGILVALWFLLDEEPEHVPVKLNNGQKKAAVQKKDEKKPGSGAPTFETLSPEQKRYIDSQYQLSFDLYKNREYDKCLLELAKIFSLVSDYKNAREIEAFAREGKRKLEAQEEERKRKEQEKQAQLKLQSLIEQASHLMDQKKYKEAEMLFPEIELLQPENVAVGEWRKQIIAEAERLDREKDEKNRITSLHAKAKKDFEAAVALESSKKYYESLDRFDEILSRDLSDQKLIGNIKDEIKKVEGLIDAARDPFLNRGKELESDGKLSEAYREYQKAAEADPMDEVGPAGMKRIRGVLTERAKHLYTEGVFAESYGDVETAEKKYREVLEVVPKDDDYYIKADSKVRKLTIYKRAGAASSESSNP